MALLAHKSSVVAPAQRASAKPLRAVAPVARRTAVSVRPRHIVRSASEEEPSMDPQQLLKDLQDKWDKVENKPQKAIYAVGSVVALWLTDSVLDAVNTVPLLPRILEFVGLSYSAWFTWRYLLYKSSREELVQEIEEIKKKVAGDQ